MDGQHKITSQKWSFQRTEDGYHKPLLESLITPENKETVGTPACLLVLSSCCFVLQSCLTWWKSSPQLMRSDNSSVTQRSWSVGIQPHFYTSWSVWICMAHWVCVLSQARKHWWGWQGLCGKYGCWSGFGGWWQWSYDGYPHTWIWVFLSGDSFHCLNITDLGKA